MTFWQFLHEAGPWTWAGIILALAILACWRPIVINRAPARVTRPRLSIGLHSTKPVIGRPQPLDVYEGYQPVEYTAELGEDNIIRFPMCTAPADEPPTPICFVSVAVNGVVTSFTEIPNPLVIGRHMSPSFNGTIKKGVFA